MAEIVSTLSASGSEGTPANGGGSYTLMSVWEADQQGVLTGTDNPAGEPSTSTLLCYAFECVDTASITGWTTDSTYHVVIKAADGEGHGGVIGAGFILSSNISYGSTLSMSNADYIEVDGITVRNTNTGDSSSVLSLPYQLGSFTNIIGIMNGSSGDAFYIRGANVVYSCLAVHQGAPGISNGFRFSGYTNFDVYSCTSIDFSKGYYRLDGGTGGDLRNCVGYGNTTDFVDIDKQTATPPTNLASGDTSAIGANSIVSIPSTAFVDYAGGDYSPASGGLLDGTGADLSTQFTTDITGATRTVPWTIGAYIVSGAPPIGIQEMYVNIGGTFTKAIPSVLVGGAWQPADAYVLVAGVWKPVYEQ